MKSYLDGEKTPSLDKFLRMTRIPEIGPLLASEMMGMAGYDATPANDGDPDPWKMNQQIITALHVLSGFLADGRIDHRENPIWRIAAKKLALQLIAHANARE